MTSFLKLLLRLSAFYCLATSAKASMFFDGCKFDLEYFFGEDFEVEFGCKKDTPYSSIIDRGTMYDGESPSYSDKEYFIKEYYSVASVLQSEDDYFFLDLDSIKGDIISSAIVPIPQNSVLKSAIKPDTKPKAIEKPPEIAEHLVLKGNEIVPRSTIEPTQLIQRKPREETSPFNWLSNFASNFSPKSIAKSLSPRSRPENFVVACEYLDEEMGGCGTDSKDDDRAYYYGYNDSLEFFSS